MKLYLARHGQAAPTEPDADRALTGRGRVQVERLALFLGTSGIEVDTIFHSPLRRARETAEIFARSLARTARCEPLDGLKPSDPEEALSARLSTFDGDTMLVTHLPLVERLLSLLVAGSPAPRVAPFTPGTVVCLDQARETSTGGSWEIVWFVPPVLLGDVDYLP